MMKISRMLTENNISRVPIVDEHERLIGIVTDRDIKEASPSKATTLDMHELYYLLSELKARDIMTADPVFVTPDDTVEDVAQLMLDKRLTGLPVVDEDKKVVGIITEHDIFKVLVEITGVRYGGLQIALLVEDVPGAMRPIFDTTAEFGANVITILTSDGPAGPDNRIVYIRFHAMDADKEKQLIDVVGKKFDLLYWTH